MGEVVDLARKRATRKALEDEGKVEATGVARALELALWGYTMCFGLEKTVAWLEGEARRLKDANRGA